MMLIASHVPPIFNKPTLDTAYALGSQVHALLPSSIGLSTMLIMQLQQPEAA
jgi:hypothetical protein